MNTSHRIDLRDFLGKQTQFYATFGGRGAVTSSRRLTTLLEDIRDINGWPLADHLWVPQSAPLERLYPTHGDRLSLRAKVVSYHKRNGEVSFSLGYVRECELIEPEEWIAQQRTRFFVAFGRQLDLLFSRVPRFPECQEDWISFDIGCRTGEIFGLTPKQTVAGFKDPLEHLTPLQRKRALKRQAKQRRKYRRNIGFA